LRDEALVKAILDGQTGLFEELVDAYKDRIFSMACRFTGSIHEGQDLAQEIFLLIYRNLKSFKGQSSLSTWIYRVSLNRCLDWQRKQKRMKWKLFQAIQKEEKDIDIFQNLASSVDTPEEAYLKQEEQKILHEKIRRLPEKYQVVIILYHFQDCSYQQISEILDIPVRTVETQLYRAKQKLRKMLRNQMDEKKEVQTYEYARS